MLTLGVRVKTELKGWTPAGIRASENQLLVLEDSTSLVTDVL